VNLRILTGITGKTFPELFCPFLPEHKKGMDRKRAAKRTAGTEFLPGIYIADFYSSVPDNP
jgi:hypothetical protein